MEDPEKSTQGMNVAREGSETDALQKQDGSKRTHGLSREPPSIVPDLAFSWLWIIPCICVFGIFIIFIYTLQLPSGIRWGAFGVSVVIGSSAFLIGGLVGFLFGIPRTVTSSTRSTGATQYRGNTNLEQVSDWLTKIIVGISLVEIGRIVPALAKLAGILKAPLGGQPSSAAFGLGVVIASALTGFFFFYLWTREEFFLELGLLFPREKQPRQGDQAHRFLFCQWRSQILTGRVVEQRAFVQARAFASGRGLQPVTDELGALDLVLDLGQLPDGELAEPFDRRMVEPTTGAVVLDVRSAGEGIATLHAMFR